MQSGGDDGGMVADAGQVDAGPPDGVGTCAVATVCPGAEHVVLTWGGAECYCSRTVALAYGREAAGDPTCSVERAAWTALVAGGCNP
jgi:hypothetical protein